MLYRVITENKNRDKIEKIVSKFFSGFTIYGGIGYYKGQKENSLIIEVATKKHWSIREVCKWIKKVNSQDCVLLQSIKADTELI